MKSFRQDTRFILMFFVFLTIFTIYSNFSLHTQIDKTKLPQGINSETAQIKPKILREPASINEFAAPILNKEFLCNPTAKQGRDKVSKSLVMISFKLCRDVKLVADMALLNQSNGFKAQIFKLEKDKFKTDFIQLSEGINRLKLELILKDGQKIEESLEILSGS